MNLVIRRLSHDGSIYYGEVLRVSTTYFDRRGDVKPGADWQETTDDPNRLLNPESISKLVQICFTQVGRNDEYSIVTHAGNAFLCNKDGKTIERI